MSRVMSCPATAPSIAFAIRPGIEMFIDMDEIWRLESFIWDIGRDPSRNTIPQEYFLAKAIANSSDPLYFSRIKRMEYSLLKTHSHEYPIPAKIFVSVK